MFDERTSQRVGAVTSIIGLLGVFALLHFQGAQLRPTIAVDFYFEHPGNLHAGSDVQLAGREIGRVRDIGLVPASAASDPAHPLHPTGGVVARARIQKRFTKWIPNNSDFFVAGKGLLGDAYVEIGPPPASEEMAKPIADGEQIRAIDPPRMELLLVISFNNMRETRRLLDEIAPDVDALGTAIDSLTATIESIEPNPDAYESLSSSGGRLADELDRLTELVGPDTGRATGDVLDKSALFLDHAELELTELGARLERLSDDLRRIRDRIPDDLGRRLSAAIGRTRAALAKIERIQRQVAALTALIRRGQGTVGALLADPEFIDNAKDLGKYLKQNPWLLLGRPQP